MASVCRSGSIGFGSTGEKRGREGVAAIVRRQVDSAPRLFRLLGLNWTGLRMRAGRSASIGPSVRLKKMGSA